MRVASAPSATPSSSAERVTTAHFDVRDSGDVGISHKTYAVSLLLMSAAFMAFLGSMILLPLYLQDIRGLSSLQTGLLERHH